MIWTALPLLNPIFLAQILVVPLPLFFKILALLSHSNFPTLFLTPTLLYSREFKLQNLKLDF